MSSRVLRSGYRERQLLSRHPERKMRKLKESRDFHSRKNVINCSEDGCFQAGLQAVTMQKRYGEERGKLYG